MLSVSFLPSMSFVPGSKQAPAKESLNMQSPNPSSSVLHSGSSLVRCTGGFKNNLSYVRWCSNLALAKIGLVKQKLKQLENSEDTTKDPLSYISIVFRGFSPQKSFRFLSFTQVSDINRNYAGCPIACGYMQYIFFIQTMAMQINNYCNQSRGLLLLFT